MKRFFLSILVLAMAFTALRAEDKVVRKVLELGKTDNRVMEHVKIVTTAQGENDD
jgi:hypothetical protein